MNTPQVSIIIPVRNGARTIEKCLRSLFELRGPEYEIIVIDDGSSDATRQILASLGDDIPGSERLRIILLEKSRGASHARNRGITEARGEYIAFTDADCFVDPGWLEALIAPVKDPAVAGSGGLQLSPSDDTFFGRMVHDLMAKIGFVADYMKDPSTAGAAAADTEHNPSCNSLYRTAVLRQVGGFWEDLWPGEDVDLDYRIRKAGYRLVFTPSAVVYHYRPRSFGGFWRMMFNYGRVQAFLVRRHGRFRKVQAIPAVFVTGVTLSVLAELLRPGSLLIILEIVFAALWLLFVFRRVSPVSAARYALLGLAALLAWNLGFITGQFSKLPGSSNP